MSEQRLVKLSSATGEVFEVAEAVASQSQFVRNLIEDVGVENPIPLPNVSSETLGEVLDYCKRHVENVDQMNEEADLMEALEDYLSEWPADAGLGKADMDHLYDLIMAANYMHIETLLHMIYHGVAMMIAKKTFQEIRQIFNFRNDFGIGEGHLHEEGNQILASFMESLPTELQFKIKIKVAQRFHQGEWSPWWYDVDAQTLFVELANLYHAYNMHKQIAIILLQIDIGLVNTLVLQTCRMMSLSSHQSRGQRIDWIDQMDMDLFRDLIDGIDMLKIENLIFDDKTIN